MKKLLQKGKFALSLSKGFTLIELLIVIGILGILVVAVLLTLNPAEGQRKARDTQRMKDLATLQSVMDQAVADAVFTVTIATVNSGTGTARNCNNGWIGNYDLCKYITNLPVDPLLGKAANFAGVAGSAAGCLNTSAPVSKTAAYYVSYDNATGAYEVNVRQESTSNCKNLNNDGGDSSLNVEAGTDTGLNLLTDN